MASTSSCDAARAIADSSPDVASVPADAAKLRKAMFIVLSGDMERMLAAFVMAATAAASGLQTTMFFMFWSVPALRDKPGTRRKGLLDRMLGALIPRGPRALPTSRLNFAGLGPRFFRWRMAKKQLSDLPALMEQAEALGIRLLVCDNSLDMFGLGLDELRDGVGVAGAMTCLREAADSEVALFV